jgi:membrane fusion protein, multidrug efflux system
MNRPVDPAPVVAAQKLNPPARKRRAGRWIAAVALCLAALLALQYYERIAPGTLDAQKPATPAGAPPQTVRDADAVKGDIPIVINALGTVTPIATITVRTQIAGTLQQVAFTEGQLVNAGDFLAQIDSRPFQATQAQAKGQLAKDTALLAQAQSDLGRYQTLSKQDSIAHQQVDDQSFLVQQDKAAMASDQAQIDAANLNINYTHITAPISGRVGFRLVDQGNYVQPSDASGLVVITQLQPITVFFSIPEDSLQAVSARLKSGAMLPVTVLDRQNVKQLAVGQLTTIDNAVDATTGTVKLRATFANDDFALFPNQFVNVQLLVDTLAGAVVAPNAAIQLGSIGNFVYVVRDDETVTVRKVTIGAADASRTDVLSGLSEGEKVVIDGVDRLREGAKVQVRNGSGGAAPASSSTPATDPATRGQGRRRQKDPTAASDAAPSDAAKTSAAKNPAPDSPAGAAPPPP